MAINEIWYGCLLFGIATSHGFMASLYDKRIGKSVLGCKMRYGFVIRPTTTSNETLFVADKRKTIFTIRAATSNNDNREIFL